MRRSKTHLKNILFGETPPPIVGVLHSPEKLVVGAVEDVGVVHHRWRDRRVPHDLEHLVAIQLVVAGIDVCKDDRWPPKPNVVLSPEHVETGLLLDVFEGESRIEPGRLHLENNPQCLANLVHLQKNKKLQACMI